MNFEFMLEINRIKFKVIDLDITRDYFKRNEKSRSCCLKQKNIFRFNVVRCHFEIKIVFLRAIWVIMSILI